MHRSNAILISFCLNFLWLFNKKKKKLNLMSNILRRNSFSLFFLNLISFLHGFLLCLLSFTQFKVPMSSFIKFTHNLRHFKTGTNRKKNHEIFILIPFSLNILIGHTHRPHFALGASISLLLLFCFLFLTCARYCS